MGDRNRAVMVSGGWVDDVNAELAARDAEIARLREKLADTEALAMDLGGSRCEDCGRVVCETPIHSEDGSFCEDCYEAWRYECASCSYRTDDISDSDSCPECGALLDARAALEAKPDNKGGEQHEQT